MCDGSGGGGGSDGTSIRTSNIKQSFPLVIDFRLNRRNTEKMERSKEKLKNKFVIVYNII